MTTASRTWWRSTSRNRTYKLNIFRSLEEKQLSDHQSVMKHVEEENEKLRQVISEQETKLEAIINAKETIMKTEDENLKQHIDKVEAENVVQDVKIEQSEGRIDQLKDNHHSHSEILEAILKELKEKDKVKHLNQFSFSLI